MLSFFLTWLMAALSLVITSYLVPGLVVKSFIAAAVAAVILGLVNAIVKPILTILTLPITVLSLGLFLFVVNAITLSLAGFLSPGFDVNGFWPALFGSIVLSLVSGLLGRFLFREA
ncbi:MAG: phage holin family protein [Coleofasciculaceae cyanobacterium]